MLHLRTQNMRQKQMHKAKYKQFKKGELYTKEQVQKMLEAIQKEEQ